MFIKAIKEKLFGGCCSRFGQFDVQEAKLSASPKTRLDLAEGRFDLFALNRHQDAIWGVSTDQKLFIKIGVSSNPRKANSLKEEGEILARLTEKGTWTAPKLCNRGTLNAAQAQDLSKVFGVSLDPDLGYMICDFIPSKKSLLLGDVLLAVIEQKKAGVFQGDLKPNNVRAVDNYAKLIDYDQALILTKEQSEMPNREFLRWAGERAKKIFGKECLFEDFGFKNFEDVLSTLFIGDSLDLSKTSIFLESDTTRAENKIYHTLSGPDVCVQGVRVLDERRKLLDQVEFSSGEKTLDIGCNIGLLCHYLADRGCMPSGHDIDSGIINAARIIANITSRKISFASADLDKLEKIEPVDTVFIFSVLHHTQNVEANAAKIAQACQRVFIECRLSERGAKPISQGNWISTSTWSFENVQSLVAYLEKIFPSFHLVKNYGQCDKGRFLLELRKEI